ncbi:MAG: D-2-hydroxyacid dehydrogenase [Chloroflexi bacterium]|nr:D-2-hydroxyacid dehydrogenase [Chloroflexota bacterium]
MTESSHDQIVVTLPERLRPGFLDGVHAVSPRVEIVLVPNEGPIPSEAERTTVFYRSWAFQRRVAEELIERARNLRWMHVPSAGIEIALTPQVLQRNFVITRMAGVYDTPVAELTLTLMLSAAKRMPAYLTAQREGRWLRAATWDEVQQEQVLPQLLHGQTVGIVGFGGSGARLSEMARAMGMRVLGLRRNPRPDPRTDAMYGPSGLHELLSESDFVVLTLPLTPDTERIIDANALGRMKPTAWLVNVARGLLVDDDALIAALESGRIGGACLDVFSKEPLPEGHAYYRLPNVIVTPHIAGAFPELNEVDREYFVRELRRFVEGKPLDSVVERAKGY